MAFSKYWNSRNLTNLERIMKQALDNEGLQYIQEYPLRSGFVIDFALKDSMIAIECDGEKWHGTNKAKRRDRFRDYLLKRAGWTTIRFTGHEIEKNITACIEKIKKYISA